MLSEGLSNASKLVVGVSLMFSNWGKEMDCEHYINKLPLFSPKRALEAGGDPNIVWRDLLSPSSFTWTANKPICIFWLNGDGAYQSGTSSYPRAKGDNLSGLPPRYYALDEQDNTPFLETSFANIDLTFRPNIKIFYT